MKLDVTLGDLTKIGKSQKYTLSVDVEGGKLVVLKKQKDSQEDWNTFTHDKSKSPWPPQLLHPEVHDAQGMVAGRKRGFAPGLLTPIALSHPSVHPRPPRACGEGTVLPQRTPLCSDARCLPAVRQLIKSQRVQNKLGIVFEKEKDKTQRKDFIFVSARVSGAS